jgi:hypothetical protein
MMPFSILPAGTFPGQAQSPAPGAAFETGALAAGERRLSAIRLREILGSVVGGEDDDGVVVEPIVLQVREHRADDIVELRHADFLDRGFAGASKDAGEASTTP